MHMREAIDKLMADFNKFMQENAGFKGSVGNPPTQALAYGIIWQGGRGLAE